MKKINDVKESFTGNLVTSLGYGFLVLTIVFLIVDKTTDLAELSPEGKRQLMVAYGVFIFLSLLLSFTVFLNLRWKKLRENIISDDAITQIQNGAKSIEEFQTIIGTSLEKIENNLAQSESISNNLEDYKSTKTTPLESKEILYARLKEARAKCQNHGGGIIYMTNFLIELTGESLQYYEEEIELCQKYKNVIVKKLITIHDQTKFDTYKRIVDRAVEHNITNLHLAYLHIQKFERSDLTRQPGIMGVQVLSETKVILMNPCVARLSDYHPEYVPLVINGEFIPEACADYHKLLWDQIKNSNVNEHGCILYDGGQDIRPGTIQATPEIWKQVEKQMNDVNAVIPSRTVYPEIWEVIDKYRQEQLSPPA